MFRNSIFYTTQFIAVKKLSLLQKTYKHLKVFFSIIYNAQPNLTFIFVPENLFNIKNITQNFNKIDRIFSTYKRAFKLSNAL